jgi:rubrerythrin
MKARSFFLSIIAFLCFISAGHVIAQAAYPQTVAVMKNVLTRELLAHARYAALAIKAREEGYPHIAYLADALCFSEGVHARNCLTILADLDSPSDEQPPVVPMADTRTNLKTASLAELDEIDVRYPQYLAQIKTENVVAAIDDLTHAWQAEKQHRDLIEKILSGTGVFFGLMVQKIEGNPVDYFVCDNCGSTLIAMPKDKCPICGESVSHYQMVQQPAS